MNIAVIGIGHVGLVTGLVFASNGHRVTCLEKNNKVREELRKGVSHIYEPGIEKLLQRSLENGNIDFTPSEETYLEGADVIFICVNTPVGNDGIDFSQLKDTLLVSGKAIAAASKFVTVVIKSTVVPGTTAGMVKDILEEISGKRNGEGFGLAANPEFLREGSGVDDFIHADRIVIGTESEKAKEMLLSIYEPWQCERVLVNSATAEFIKYHNNILLSLLISFSNEMSKIAMLDKSIDFRDVLNGVSLDKRLNTVLPDRTRIHPEILSYLVPGPGFGGSCLPKDLEALAYYSKQMGLDSSILNAVIKTNEEQPAALVELMRSRIGELRSKRILVLGLTHKPQTDDIRASVSVDVVDLLAKEEAALILHDPVAMDQVAVLFEGNRRVSFTGDWIRSLDTCDVVVLMTAWDEYRKMAEPVCEEALRGKYIVDARYMFTGAAFEGSHYISF